MKRFWRGGVLIIILLAGLVAGCSGGKPPRGGLLVIAASPGAERALAGLLDLRRAQGYQVVVRTVPPKSSYAQIQKAIDAARGCVSKPTHLLLVGSDSILPMARRPNNGIQVIDTAEKLATDQLYGGENGGGPLAVGRLPLDDPAVLGRAAAKIAAYENSLAQLKPELFLLAGRQPADPKPNLLGVSEQSIVDASSAGFVANLRGKLTRLHVAARTAFPGPDHFEFAQGLAALRAGLEARPIFAVYAGHADMNCFATYNTPDQDAPITLENIGQLGVKTICGPMFSGGCSMLKPGGKARPIGEELALAPGGPVAFAGYTGINDDYMIMQTFETLTDELARPRTTTMGELLASVRRRVGTEPQSPASKLVEIFMRQGGQLDPRRKVAYPAVAGRNNAMLTLIGDPCTTFVIP